MSTPGRFMLSWELCSWNWFGCVSVGVLAAWLWVAPAVHGAEDLPAGVRTENVASNSVTLNIDSSLSRVWLPVRLNEAGPYHFLLDTGYDLTMVHPDYAEALGLEQAGGVWIIGIAGRERATYFRGARLDFQGMLYTPRRVAALPSERQRRYPRDGILGSGFFRRFVVEIDEAQGQARLHEPASFHYEGKGEVLMLPFEKETPILEATLAGGNHEPVVARFEIDTGCDGGLCLGSKFVETNEWLLPEGEGRESYRRGVGGGARTISGRVPQLRLGSLRVNRLSAEFFREGSPAGAGLAGHIGWEALRNFKVIFDYSRSRLILESHQEAP